MQFAPIRVEYSLAREREGGDAFFIDIEGTPETLAEMHQFGGKTRQTCTLAEAEAKGITLPTAFAAIDTHMASQFANLQASIVQINQNAQTRVDTAEAARSQAEATASTMEARALIAEARVAELTAELAAERAKAPAQE